MNPITLKSFNTTQCRPMAVANRFAGTAQGAPVGDRYISVQGTGSVSKVPDVMSMTLSFSEQGKKRDEVTNKLNDRANQLIKAVKDLNLPVKLATGFNVGRWTEWENNKHVFKGFNGNFTLSITEKGAKLDELKKHAATLTDIGAAHNADFSDPGFGYSKVGEAAIEAIGDAASTIKATAEALAKAFGVRISPLPAQLTTGVSYNNGGGVRAASLAKMAPGAADGGMSSETIETGNITVNSPTINALFEILPATPSRTKTK